MWHPLEGRAPKGERTWNKLSGPQAMLIWAENFSAPSLEALPASPHQLPPPAGTSRLSRWSCLSVFSSEICKCHGNGARQSRWQGFPSVRQKLEEHKLQVTWLAVDTCSIFLLQFTLHEWARLGSHKLCYHQGIQFEKYFHGFPLSMTSVHGIISWWFRDWALRSYQGSNSGVLTFDWCALGKFLPTQDPSFLICRIRASLCCSNKQLPNFNGLKQPTLIFYASKVGNGSRDLWRQVPPYTEAQ